VGHLELPYKSSLCSCIGSPRVINGYNLFPTKIQYTTQTCQKRIFCSSAVQNQLMRHFPTIHIQRIRLCCKPLQQFKSGHLSLPTKTAYEDLWTKFESEKTSPESLDGIWMGDVVSCFHIHQRSRLNSKSLSTRKLNWAIVCTKHKNSFYFLQHSKRIVAGT